uniref:Putative secreted protein n=1 Tax=Anopheles marajoara TaxID=58244 RepID=A0A2M4C8Y0_9DIPT
MARTSICLCVCVFIDCEGQFYCSSMGQSWALSVCECECALSHRTRLLECNSRKRRVSEKWLHWIEIVEPTLNLSSSSGGWRVVLSIVFFQLNFEPTEHTLTCD